MATGRARPATRPSSALTEQTGDLATVPAPSTTTYARPAPPPPPPGSVGYWRSAPPPPVPARTARRRLRDTRPVQYARSTASTAGRESAGFVLAVIFWGLVAMPFLQGGPAQVRKVWAAKFLNKAPDGSWLP